MEPREEMIVMDSMVRSSARLFEDRWVPKNYAPYRTELYHLV